MIRSIISLITLLGVYQLQAQNPPVGTWHDNVNTPSSIVTHTDGAVGIGTTVPEAKTEVRYCPPFSQNYPGLLISKILCLPPLPGGGTVIPGGFDDTPGQEDTTGEPTVSITPSHSYVSVTPLNYPLQSFPSNMEPLLWARVQTPTAAPLPGKNDSRFIVYPDGRSGINIADPRCALDVRGFGVNAPAAIFGTNAQRVPVDPNALVPRRYTRHIEIVPHLGHKGYNSISRQKDLGILFSDGLGDEGSNLEGALVIAPWRQDSITGGLRMSANGNTELRGELRCAKITVNAKWWPDFVFSSNYKLMPLNELDSFIRQNHHLPGIPREDSITATGLDLGNIQILQQQKIEELTLHTIEQQKTINYLNEIIKLQNKNIKDLQDQSASNQKRIDLIENKISK